MSTQRKSEKNTTVDLTVHSSIRKVKMNHPYYPYQRSYSGELLKERTYHEKESQRVIEHSQTPIVSFN